METSRSSGSWSSAPTPSRFRTWPAERKLLFISPTVALRLCPGSESRTNANPRPHAGESSRSRTRRGPRRMWSWPAYRHAITVGALRLAARKTSEAPRLQHLPLDRAQVPQRRFLPMDGRPNSLDSIFTDRKKNDQLSRAISTPNVGWWCARRAVAFSAISVPYGDG
jgi:hypothetical protein